MVQEFVSNLLLSIINRIFQNTTHLYYALGVTVLVLVSSYFLYKWYFASPPAPKAVAFVEPPVQHSEEAFQEESMPHIQQEQVEEQIQSQETPEENQEQTE